MRRWRPTAVCGRVIGSRGDIIQTVRLPRIHLVEIEDLRCCPRIIRNYGTDYLRFETETLTRDVAIAGKIDFELFAATDGLDTDFMVKLVDVYS